MREGKGIYRFRCVSGSCGAVMITFAPISQCEKCSMPVSRIEYRPLGTEGEEETIRDLYESVIDGLEDLLAN